MIAAPTYVLTLKLDSVTFARLDELRRRHFRAHLNLIPAHLTLFHKLEGDLKETLQRSALREPIALTFSGMRFLGRGVAIDVTSPTLPRLRADLAAEFADQLTPQDRQAFRPHVTIQNKVAPAEARALFDELTSEFAPFTGWGEGLLLWRYLGGPWRLEAEFTFNER